jgi:hypothetical protein
MKSSRMRAKTYVPATRGSTAHSAGNLRNSCSTAELCRRRVSIGAALRYQLIAP